MPWFYHPNLPREQTVEHPGCEEYERAGWLPVDDQSTPEPPAEPVKPERASASLNLTKE